MTDSSAFFLDQISKAGRPFNTKADCILVQCPIHANGQERTPSRKVNLSNPRFKVGESFCYACHDEQKTLTWNQLASVMNMLPIRSEDDSGEEGDDQLWFTIPPPEDFYGSEASDIAHMPWKGNWTRDGVTISGKFLRSIGATEVNSRDEPRLYLPVTVDGIEVGNVQCVVNINEESSKIKYLLSGKWTQYTMYPVDKSFAMAEKLGFLVIVEGARDALNLVQHGVPAVCIWGTNGWNKAKRDSLTELGVKLIIAMDGDEAGQNAKAKILADLKTLNFPCSTIDFPEDMDPGKLSKEDIKEILSIFGDTPNKDAKTWANTKTINHLLSLYSAKRSTNAGRTNSL